MTTLREAAQAALAEMKHANKVMLSEAGIGVVDVIAIAKLEAALAEFDASLPDPAKATVHQIDEQAQPVAWMVYTEDGKSVYVTDNPNDISEKERALPLFTRPDTRVCTCHPDDNPPIPCARKYALDECRSTADAIRAAVEAEREACALVCESMAGVRGTGKWSVLITAAAAIRNRSVQDPNDTAIHKRGAT